MIPTANNRQKQRMRTAIEQAFISLCRERSYEAVTVADITERANVGRTTFYRYYQTKADVLLGIHADRFRRMQFAPINKAEWLTAAPPPQLITFFEQAQHQGRFMPYLHELGKDVDRVTRHLDDTMTAYFHDNLTGILVADDCRIPLPVLAHTLAGSFTWVLRWWVQDRPAYTPAEIAAHTHSLLRAQFIAAA